MFWQIYQLSFIHMLFQDGFLDQFRRHILLKLYNAFLGEIESQSKISRNKVARGKKGAHKGE